MSFYDMYLSGGDFLLIYVFVALLPVQVVFQELTNIDKVVKLL